MKQISVEKGKEYMELIEGICRLIHLSIPELTAVLYDIKPVMADMINFEKFDQNFKNKLNQASQLCKKLGFKMAVSKYKFVINSPRGIFEMVEMSDKRKGKIAIGVSKNIDKALEGVELYYKKMFDSKYGRRFGEVMGYPECCLKFGDYLCNNNDDSDNFGFANPAAE